MSGVKYLTNANLFAPAADQWAKDSGIKNSGGGLSVLKTSNNLSELTDGNAARISLGVRIGADVQAFSSKLAAYASADTPSPFMLSLVNKLDQNEWRAAIGAGTVNNVTLSGGNTGLLFTGGSIVESGTITLEGTLASTHGGTGFNSLIDLTNAITELQNSGVVGSTDPVWSVFTGGELVLKANNGGTTTAGFNITVRSGSSTGFAGGEAIFTAGSGTAGGNAFVIGGDGSSDAGGKAEVRGGSTIAVNAIGGAAVLKAGASTNGTGGGTTIQSGTGSAEGGNIIIVSGNGGSGRAGDISITGGNSTSDKGGAVNIVGGLGGTTGGDITLKAGTDGFIRTLNLPVTLPSQADALWSNGGVICQGPPNPFTKLSTYTVATLPIATGANADSLIILSDGDAGQPCLALARGGSWRIIPIGVVVS